MEIKFNMKTRIVFNGKEYGSPEELPENVREAYEKATAEGESGAHAPQAHARITYNGHEYTRVEDMPPEARRLYDAAMALAGKGQKLSPGQGAPAIDLSTSDAAPITPGGAPFAGKKLLLILAAGAALIILFVLIKVLLSAR